MLILPELDDSMYLLEDKSFTEIMIQIKDIANIFCFFHEIRGKFLHITSCNLNVFLAVDDIFIVFA